MAKKTKLSDMLWLVLSMLIGLMIIYAFYLLVQYWSQSTLQNQLFL